MIDKLLQDFDISRFQHDLIKWYQENKRDLPWRKSQDPYKVWISEIMLQQTKVDTVIPYFYHFTEKYPTPQKLAQAEEQEVLKAWEGLGYYSRARNLHTAVKEVVAKYDGQVPSDEKHLGKLKGIGPYTKGAILSIAFDQPVPAVDGNVMRVFSRVLHIEEDIAQAKTKKLFEKVVGEVISKEDPSSFNQGLMELGALVCTPKKPQCSLCPVNEHCQAFALGAEEKLPIKSKAKKQKRVSYVALLIQDEQGRIVIEKRADNGLLANLWQFPMVPIKEVGFTHLESYVYREHGIPIQLQQKQGNLRHVFSHLIWEIDIYQASIISGEKFQKNKQLKLVSKQELEQYPFPVPHQKMMKYI